VYGSALDGNALDRNALDSNGPARRLKSRRLLVLALVLFAAGCVSGGSDAEEAGPGADQDSSIDAAARSEFKPTVNLGVTDWTAARLNAAIAEQIIERRLGYPVEPVPVLDTRRMLRDLADGELDAVLELWPSSLDERSREMLSSGQVENLGELGVDGKVGWFVPRYVLDDLPQLTTWEPLASPEVAARFATSDTGDRGRFLGTDSNFEEFDQEIIDQLGLPFEVVYSGSEEATRSELAAAAAESEPVLLYWWTPTAEVAKFDLVNLALPPRTAACQAEIDAGDPQRCDYPEDRLFKVGSPELAAAPELHRFFSAFSLTTEDQLDLIDQVENRGRSVDEVAAGWIADHEQRWSAWLP